MPLGKSPISHSLLLIFLMERHWRSGNKNLQLDEDTTYFYNSHGFNTLTWPQEIPSEVELRGSIVVQWVKSPMLSL